MEPTFDDLVGRLHRLRKQAASICEIADRLRALETTGPAETELLHKLMAGLVDDLNNKSAMPPPLNRI